MEKYIKPDMEVVVISNLAILTDVTSCDSKTPELNQDPIGE